LPGDRTVKRFVSVQEDHQNNELLDLSRQILQLTKEFVRSRRNASRKADPPRAPARSDDRDGPRGALPEGLTDKAAQGEELAELQRGLCAAVVECVLDDPEDYAEHCVADRRLTEGSPVGGELRQFLAGRVVAVEHHGQRPCRDVLDEGRK
jgi:hypothetical protein